MKNNLVKGFKANMKRVIKHGSFYPYLYAFLALLMVSTVFFMGVGFNTGNEGVDIFLEILLIVVLVTGVIFSFPFFYGVSLSVANDSRFSDNNKVSIKETFQGYKVNNNIYNVFMLILKGFLASFVIELLMAVIILPIVYGCYPDLVKEINEYFDAINNAVTGQEVTLEEIFSRENLFLLSQIIYFSQASAAFVLIVYLGRQIRKSERIFFISNTLLTSNKMNVAVGLNGGFLKKLILPTVEREYKRLDFKINYVGYIVFTLVFGGMITISYFFFGEYAAIIGIPCALLLACLCYSPFHYYTRVFDCLFYIAYEDTMLERLPEQAQEMVFATREKMKEFIPKGQEQKDDNVTETSVDDTTPDDVKVGEQKDDVIDYTDDSRKE